MVEPRVPARIEGVFATLTHRNGGTPVRAAILSFAWLLLRIRTTAGGARPVGLRIHGWAGGVVSRKLLWSGDAACHYLRGIVRPGETSDHRRVGLALVVAMPAGTEMPRQLRRPRRHRPGPTRSHGAVRPRQVSPAAGKLPESRSPDVSAGQPRTPSRAASRPLVPFSLPEEPVPWSSLSTPTGRGKREIRSPCAPASRGRSTGHGLPNGGELTIR